MNMIPSLDARTGHVLATLAATSPAEVDSACDAALSAFPLWRASSGAQRASLLRALADALEADRESLVGLADAETALGGARLNGELDRTAFQLRRFADLAEGGVPYAVIDDPQAPGAPPAGHPAMQRWRLPLGPVAMYAASNFPFAFSVLGGDTAAALAAGCPVVVKAHPSHLLTSRRVFELASQAIAALELPTGLLGLIQEQGHEAGLRLIRHPAIAAGAFTGSVRGGAALAAEAAGRARPIPFYGELGSINPIVALPWKLAAEGQALAGALAASITMGCGQFCTSPGVLVLIDELRTGAKASNDAFVAQLALALGEQRPHPMLNDAMRQALDAGVARWQEAGAQMLLHDPAAEPRAPRPVLAQATATQFIEHGILREEVFGPACMVVRASDPAQALRVLEAIGGSLTVTLWGADEDDDLGRQLVAAAMAIAGRVLFSGVPTGVAVTRAQQHGGPWPSSTRPESTSVGDAALERFLRPVCLQDAPRWLTARAGRPV
ncbi:aldehyde dehydrogenase (NADP(+)) [Bordetella pseudohinzii]|uniref:Aldehyde dehydrogenase n=1 Tax=Bordetella pseudohinzii TaxID=1331258 RepID=A0A0J6C7W0_9BORD|nr:aldehyde dehydrogenase (NADP(+)) [Bordetella pseudohinzii]ANY16812.1 aldehyde dehydrogenase [Bordetella pseudohinzii]KMM25432.1 aldehyde dehydrogenase [Bordetella pseudohinzii]KXA77312.1 aldehyde dehydrogenase [Bordetella pseudohinzii]KXA78888.1 aldehyde dehydrogenase [Bordetella pseudohinzii]CUI91753.1 NADP-dependent fatty aldehyde dehydrogenase [Bordetella pseudohinzii]